MLSSRETFPGICADPKISSGCPVACAATSTDCYKPRLEEDTKKYSIFNRIMRVDTRSQHHTGAVLFVRDLFDPVDACLKHVPTEDLWHKAWVQYGNKNLDVNISDCAQVRTALFRYRLPISNWNDTVHADIIKSGGYSMSFWMRINDVPPNAGQRWYRKFRMWVFSSLYPPRPLFLLRTMDNPSSVVLRHFTTCDHITEDVRVYLPQEWQPDRWYFVSISYGAERNGLKEIQLQIDTTTESDYMNIPWCAPDWSQSPNFVEAIQATKGTTLSPIEITSTGPVPTKKLQALYYSQVKKMDKRMGPSASDEDREDKPIEYDRQIFSSPLALIAPPIILQQRKTPSSRCNNELGTAYVADLW